MPALAAFVLAGVMLGFWQPVFSSDHAMLVWFIPLAGIAGWLWRVPGVVVVTALTLTSLDCRVYRDDILAAVLAGQDLLISGTVASIPQALTDQEGQRFDLHLKPGLIDLPPRVRLSWYEALPVIGPGECWELLVRLKPPHGVLNQAGFDRQLNLLVQNVGATGYVRESSLNQRCRQSLDAYRILRLRARYAQWLAGLLGESSGMPLLVGISVGIRTHITQAQWSLLRDTGTAHLMAISGLHVGMLAGAIWVLAKSLLRIAQPLSPVFRAGAFAPLVCAGSVILYAALAGFALPTARAVCMLLVALWLQSRRRFWRPDAVVGFAFVLFALANPRMLLAAASWLSFGAVILLVSCVRPVAYPAGAGAWRRLLPNCSILLRAQWVLALGLAPLLLLFFDQVSLLAPLANLAAVPVFSFLIMPLTLVGQLMLLISEAGGVQVLLAACRLLEWLLQLLQFLREHLPATWSPGPVGLLPGLMYVLALAALLLPRPWPIMSTAALLVALGFGADALMPRPALRVEILDVGQGLAVLLEAEGRVLLYDTGPAWRGGDAGQLIIAPVLRKRGIRRLDTLVISHADNDHSGGFASIRKQFPVATVYEPTSCRAGMHWQWGDTRFRFLHPRNPAGWSDNNASCVLLVEHYDFRILLPGDIERRAEQVLLGRDSVRDLHLLVAPHHGSSTSSSEHFVQRLQPRFVVFTTGFLNRWGFPDKQVRRRWQQTGACLLNTATAGSLTFTISHNRVASGPLPARGVWHRPWLLRRGTPCPVFARL